VNVNIPLLFVASIISDVDLLIPSLEHRGPTHSLIIFILLFLPAFTLYGKIAAPYFIALAQHSLIGDYLTGEGIQLLWPIASNWYGTGISMTSLTIIVLEWISFLTCLGSMLKAKDASTLFQHHPSNLVLSIPLFTLLLPTLLGFPISVPSELIIPHITFLIILTVSESFSPQSKSF